MARVEAQTVIDALQFNGTPGRGMWSFDKFKNLDRRIDIQIDGMAYSEDPPEMGQVTTAVGFGVFRVGETEQTKRMIWGRDEAMMGNLLNPTTGNAAETFRGYRIPREPGDNGQWWSLFFQTINKGFTATATITYYLVPKHPDT